MGERGRNEMGGRGEGMRWGEREGMGERGEGMRWRERGRNEMKLDEAYLLLLEDP